MIPKTAGDNNFLRAGQTGVPPNKPQSSAPAHGDASGSIADATPGAIGDVADRMVGCAVGLELEVTFPGGTSLELPAFWWLQNSNASFSIR